MLLAIALEVPLVAAALAVALEVTLGGVLAAGLGVALGATLGGALLLNAVSLKPLTCDGETDPDGGVDVGVLGDSTGLSSDGNNVDGGGAEFVGAAVSDSDGVGGTNALCSGAADELSGAEPNDVEASNCDMLCYR